MPAANSTSCDLFLKSKAKAQLQSPAGGTARDAVRCAPIDEVWTSGRPGAELSGDGKWLAVVEADALRVVDLSSGEEAFSLPRPSVRALAFSPRGTYLLTWEKLSEGVAENLRLWRTAGGAFVCGWAQKLLGEKWQWPALRWAADESFFARAVSNEVHCFDGAAPSQTVAQRLRVPGVSNFAIAPAGSPPLVATFVPEGKGAPATVRLWRHGDYGEGRFLASKTFFKAAEAQLKFSPDGQALLVRTHVDVDTGGKSYDGASGLMHMNASGEASVMRLPKEGPIHDVQWAPDSSEFLALFGFSPPRACLFSAGKGLKVLHDFGDDARNTVCWAPHGRSFILAGFGNLGGELSFWDRKTLRCLSTADAHMTVAFEWSPDSRAFLTAVLWPRLRVENGVKLWSPSGALLQHQPHDELTIAAWRPAPLAAFDPPGDDCFVARPSAAAKPPPKKYVPPGARGGGAAGGGGKKSLAELAAAYEGGGSAALRSGPVVGAGEEEGAAGSRNAAKQKAKREAARRKKEAEAAGGGGAAAAAPEPGGAPPKAEGGGEDNSADKLLKKIRGVEKKLRQIGELRELQAGGKPLEKNQLDKISGEGEVRAELEALKLKHSEAEAKEQAAAKEGSWR